MQKYHERKIFHALFSRADGAFRRKFAILANVRLPEIVLSAFTVPNVEFIAMPSKLGETNLGADCRGFLLRILSQRDAER